MTEPTRTIRAALLLAMLASAASACQSKPQGGGKPDQASQSATQARAEAVDQMARAQAARPPAPKAIPDDVPVAVGEHGMVVSEGALATQVGVDVLASGGNAVDAAVATAFALAVVHPAAGNIGGGGFAVVRAVDGQVVALDFRETAPAGASADMYLDKDGKPTDASLEGHRASGVPGSVAGLWALHKKYGSRPWKELVTPAVKLAREGFVVDEGLSRSIAEQAKRLGKYPASAALFLPGGQAPAVGSTWKAPELADTLERIGERGPEDFYSGQTAKLMVAEMKAGGGLITAADLKKYAVIWREPIRFTYRGYTVYSMPPPSSGGVVLAMVAQMLGGDEVGKLAWHSAAHVHLVSEVWRRAYAARNQFLGDPAFVKDMPLAKLLAPAHAAALRKTIDPAKATKSADTPILIEGTHTTHFAVVDKDGMVVALTTTINASYGSAVTVTGAGFLMNNEMDDFASKPGAANTYGLVQSAANKIEPGKRMLSSMSPTIVVDADGKPFMVVGAQGGSRIITAVWQVLSNVIDHGMDVGQAVGATRVHHQHLPDAIAAEPGALTPEVERELKAMGHEVVPSKWPIGTAPAIVRRGGKEWTGAVDPRKGGMAKGY